MMVICPVHGETISVETSPDVFGKEGELSIAPNSLHWVDAGDDEVGAFLYFCVTEEYRKKLDIDPTVMFHVSGSDFPPFYDHFVLVCEKCLREKNSPRNP